jgi:DNA polymerase-3 subunit delta
MDLVRGAVADVARFDTYAAAEALVAGDTARYLRVLEGLRGEGEAPTYLLFTVSSALFSLLHGDRLNKAMQAVLARARRYPRAALDQAISRAAAIDRTIKGVGVGEPWEEFAKLGLELHAARPTTSSG